MCDCCVCDSDGQPWGALSAQQPAAPGAKDDAKTKRLDEMRALARAFRAFSVEGNERVPLEFAADPLHRWTDPTRQNSDGALWAWRSSGRPVAILAIEPQANYWSFEFVSLSTGLLKADNRRVRWEPATAGVKFQEISARRPLPPRQPIASGK